MEVLLFCGGKFRERGFWIPPGGILRSNLNCVQPFPLTADHLGPGPCRAHLGASLRERFNKKSRFRFLRLVHKEPATAHGSIQALRNIKNACYGNRLERIHVFFGWKKNLLSRFMTRTVPEIRQCWRGKMTRVRLGALLLALSLCRLLLRACPAPARSRARRQPVLCCCCGGRQATFARGQTPSSSRSE